MFISYRKDRLVIAIGSQFMFCENKDAIQTHAISGEHVKELFSYALVLTHNHTEAEDLVQETYVRALSARDRLRPESNVRGWLFTILRNIWFNQLRKIRNGPQIVATDLEASAVVNIVSPGQDSYEIYARGIDRGRVRAAIYKLSSGFRQIILLREYEELSYQEIASLLDVPPGTVMSRLARARSKLRVLLSSTSPAQAPSATKPAGTSVAEMSRPYLCGWQHHQQTGAQP